MERLGKSTVIDPNTDFSACSTIYRNMAPDFLYCIIKGVKYTIVSCNISNFTENDKFLIQYKL
jgi:hypothetical protein